jgi:hypothetical protein
MKKSKGEQGEQSQGVCKADRSKIVNERGKIVNRKMTEQMDKDRRGGGGGGGEKGGKI